MTHQVDCREQGLDCDFFVRSEDESELVEMVRMHAERRHGMSPSDDDVRSMISAA